MMHLSSVESIPFVESESIFIIEPKSQTEILSALQRLKERYTVVLNLAHLEVNHARQAADMMAGCSYAINGQASWIGEQTYVYTPNNVSIQRD